MDTLRQNDPQAIIEADKRHVWHQMVQHRMFDSVDPQIIVEGKGNRVWDIAGKVADLPLVDLWGGATVDSLPAYASGGWADAASIASGFSQTTCLPAAAHATTHCSWRWFGSGT